MVIRFAVLIAVLYQQSLNYVYIGITHVLICTREGLRGGRPKTRADF